MDIDLAEINYIAVVVGIVANMVAGGIWYSPVLFAKPWAAATGIKIEEINRRSPEVYRGYAVSIIASIVSMLILAVLVQAADADAAVEGLIIGLLVGLGFIATSNAATYAFETRPLKLYLINTLYPVVVLAVMGLVFAAWQ